MNACHHSPQQKDRHGAEAPAAGGGAEPFGWLRAWLARLVPSVARWAAGGRYVWGWTTQGDRQHWLGDGTQLWRVVLCGNRRTWWGAKARLAVRVLGQAVTGVRRDEIFDEANIEPSGTDPPPPLARTPVFAGVSGVFMGLPCLGGARSAGHSRFLSLDTPLLPPQLASYDRFRF